MKASKFSEFLRRYERYSQQFFSEYALNAPTDGELNGTFQFVDLVIHCGYWNEAHLDWTGKVLEKMEKSPMGLPGNRFRELNPAEWGAICDADPDMKRMFQVMEIEAHENFHAVQVFSQSASCQLARAFQEIAQHITSVALYAIHSGLKFKFGHSIFDTLARSEGPWIDLYTELALDLSEHLDIIEGAIQVNSAGLSTLHLIEGGAYMFQKLATRSFGVQTCNLDQKPLYSKAWTMWQQHGGESQIFFWIAADMALRFGNLDSIYPEEARPENLFLFLAKRAKKIESYQLAVGDEACRTLDNRVRHALKNNTSKLGFFFPQQSNKYGGGNPAIPNDVSIGEAEFRALPQIWKMMVLEFSPDTLPLFSSVTPKDFDAEYMDDYFNHIGKKMHQAIPGFGTDTMMVHLLFSLGARQNLNKKLMECNSDRTPEQVAVGTAKASPLDCRKILSHIANLEAALLFSPEHRPKLPGCCDKHPTPDLDQFLTCGERGSLNHYLKREYNLGLSDFIDFTEH